MFSHIDLTGLPTSATFGYAKDLPFLKDRERLEFKPGLNIIFGPNGSGKSTVLRMLAESMAAFQGGVTKVTETVLSDLRRTNGVDPMGVTVAHDGQAVVFCDPRHAVGLFHGAFDFDFMDRGMQEAMGSQKQSHGQNSMRRLHQVLGLILGNEPFPVFEGVNTSGDPHRPNEARNLLAKRMTASVPKGQPSILLDEPEANYSLLWQARLWGLLEKPENTEKYQVIVATHSAFALGIPHAHYIDVDPMFRLESELLLRMRFGRPMEKPPV